MVEVEQEGSGATPSGDPTRACDVAPVEVGHREVKGQGMG